MPMLPELAELLDQQQQDRRQLLLYSVRLDEQVRKTEQLTEESERQLLLYSARLDEEVRKTEQLTKESERQLLLYSARLDEEVRKTEQLTKEIGELVAWRDTMMRSRIYRLMLLYGRLYRAPVLGWPLRVLRRAVGGGVTSG